MTLIKVGENVSHASRRLAKALLDALEEKGEEGDIAMSTHDTDTMCLLLSPSVRTTDILL